MLLFTVLKNLLNLKKTILCSILTILALSAAAQTQKPLRVIFFSDEYTINSNLQNAFEDVLVKHGQDYTIEKVEKKPTLFNGNSYILNLPQEIDENFLNKTDYYYRSTGRKEALVTSSSLMIQSPYFDKSIKDALVKNTQDSASPFNFTGTQSIMARNGILYLKNSVPLNILSTDISRLNSSWTPAVSVTYHLKKDSDETSVSIFEKPLGGIGAWYDAVQKIVKAEKIKPLIINTGGIDIYEGIFPDSSFLPEYWKAMHIDILAFAPKDLEIIWSAIKDNPQNAPQMLATNILPIKEDDYNPFLKTQLLERGGIKIGFISLSAQRSLDSFHSEEVPFKTTDPVKAAQEALAKLKTEDKADFVILVSHLDFIDLNRVLSAAYGVDMVLNSKRSETSSFRKSKIELQDWNKEKHFYPAYLSRGNGYNLGDVKITFTKNNLGYTPTVIEDNNPTNLFTNNTFSNKFYAVNKDLFSGITKQGEPVLPGARSVSSYTGNTYISYTPLEFFNMSAAIIRQHAKTEASFIKIQPFPEQFLGGITEEEAKKWLGPDEPIIKTRVRGSQLKEVLKYTDLSSIFSGDKKDYSTGLHFASAGIKKDGNNYKINGLNINNDEYYSVSFPASLAQERMQNSSFRNGAQPGKDCGLKLHETVIGHLNDLRDNTAQKAQDLFTLYKEDYDLRKQEGLPPQDEITEELDFKLEDFGPRAVEEYYFDQLRESYIQDIITLMENEPQIAGAWRFNLRNLSLQLSNTDVKNADKYQNFSNSRLTADSQTLIQGKLDFAAEYYKDRIRWDNIVLLEYGKMSIRPQGSANYSSESVDKISLSTEYTYKSIDVKNFAGGFLIGPFLSLGYQTEFTKPDDAPRYQVLRGKGGIRLFEGKYLKDLYFALSPELDFTYPDTATKYAWEFGFKAEQPVTDKSKAIYKATVRDFFISKNANDNNDLSYEFEFDARLEMEVLRKFSIAPFINYYQAKGRSFNSVGSNLYVGVSLSYSRLFKYIPF